MYTCINIKEAAVLTAKAEQDTRDTNKMGGGVAQNGGSAFVGVEASLVCAWLNRPTQGNILYCHLP